MITKATVYSIQFTFQSNQARNTIAQELSSSTLFNVTYYTDKIKSLHISIQLIFYIKNCLLSDYYRVLGEELSEIILAFSCADEKNCKDKFIDGEKTVAIVKFSKIATNEPFLNDIGIGMRKNFNPQEFNLKLHDENISRKVDANLA